MVAPVIDRSCLDLASWSRRAASRHFRGFEQPFFGVYTRCDVAPLKAAAAATGIGSLALVYHPSRAGIARSSPTPSDA